MNCIQIFVSSHAVLISALILAAAYALIASEKINKVTVALLGACLTILFGLVSQTKFEGEKVVREYFVNYIDFNVIFLLIAMMIIVAITARSGVFSYAANKILKATKGHPVKILVALGVFTAVTSAFLDNVTTVILLMPITFAISDKLNIKPIPFLITEIFCSNIGGTATLIGDPPNIIIGSAAGLSFMDFVRELTGVVAVIMLTVIAVMVLFFKNELKTTPERMAAVAKIDDTEIVLNKKLMARSLTVLGLVIVGFVMHDYLHIETCVAALLGASILLLFEKPENVWKDVEWNTIFFFIGLFIIIGGLEATGGIRMMAEWILRITGGSQGATAMIILWASGIISGIIDNIPYTATMAPMIAEIQRTMGAHYAHPLWWCLSLGACLGGNMTIIGAAANVIVSENAAREGYPIPFMKFMKYGVATMLISLIISTVYIYLRFLIS